MSDKHRLKVKGYKDNGWEFKYNPSTKYVSAEHKNGGKQSVCEVKNGFDDKAFGHFIADCLNSVGDS